MFDMGCSSCTSCSACSSCASCSSCSSCSSCNSCGGCGGSGRGKIPKATPNNIKWEIRSRLNIDLADKEMVKFEELPPLDNWKHSCMQSGIIKLQPEQFYYYDNSLVTFVYCPYCVKVHYHIEKAYM